MRAITKLRMLVKRLTQGMAIVLAALLMLPAVSYAADEASSSVSLIEESAEAETILVPLYKSRIVQLHQPVKKISIGNTEIADILILRSNQLYIQGKDLGTTNVLLWDRGNNLIASLNVEVSHDLRSLKEKLHELLPDEDIGVHSSQGALVLSGQVSSLGVMDTALQIAESFAALSGGEEEEETATKKNKAQNLKVVNLMGVGGSHQVMLKVTVAEMSRTVIRKMGFKFNAVGVGDDKWTFGGVNGGATFPDAIDPAGLRTLVFGDFTGSQGVIGPVIDEFAPVAPTIESTGLFASFLSSDFLFNAVLDASKDNGTARILAEPTLTTLTGQEAKFLSGGEFPIPVPQENDSITIEFKEFGVGLKFLPVVLDSGRINLKLNISVSELSEANSVQLQQDNTTSRFFIPALTKRDAISTVELADGQTIGIAGLISENMRDLVQKFPGLGDMPVLGHLFRSSEFLKGESELVILVTPQLAKPFNRDEITLPTDSYVEPNDLEFYLLGMNRGRPAKVASEEAVGDSAEDAMVEEEPLPAGGGVEESFGHSLEGS